MGKDKVVQEKLGVHEFMMEHNIHHTNQYGRYAIHFINRDNRHTDVTFAFKLQKKQEKVTDSVSDTQTEEEKMLFGVLE